VDLEYLQQVRALGTFCGGEQSGAQRTQSGAVLQATGEAKPVVPIP
jgi:hypothetical protein